MKKMYRVCKNQEYKKILNDGKVIYNFNFSVYYIFRKDENKIKIGISVPKKLVKKAFKRNKIKRQINNMLQTVEKKQSIDIIIIVKKNYLESTFADNFYLLKNLLEKVFMKKV